MPKLLPHGDTEIPERDWLAVCNEEGQTGRGGGGRKEVLGREDVSVGDVGDVDVVLEVGAGAEDEGGLEPVDAGVDAGD